MEQVELMNATTESFTEDDFCTEKEKRRLELEKAFGGLKFLVIRKELFAHRCDPAITIRKDSITFNAACINGLEDVVYIQLLICEEEKMFAITSCDENEKDALRWCIQKEDKRKSRKMTCKDFTEKLYKLMNWDMNCRYKVLGYKIEFEGQEYYVFDLVVKEIFREKTKDDENETVDTRKGYYSEDIAGTFGVPVEEHKRKMQLVREGVYVSTTEDMVDTYSEFAKKDDTAADAVSQYGEEQLSFLGSISGEDTVSTSLEDKENGIYSTGSE